MSSPPRDPVPDSTASLLMRGYGYVASRAEQASSPVVETRLLGRRTYLLTGAAAARAFYSDHRLVRAHAAPRRMKRTLIGSTGVQNLDGEQHRARKAMFLRVLDANAVDCLASLFEDLWRRQLPVWEEQQRIVLVDEAGLLLTKAVCAWARVPLSTVDVVALHRDLRLMIEGGGKVGPSHWRARAARRRRERWAASLVEDVRAGRHVCEPGSPLHRVASYVEDGRPLPADVAGVELLNLLRPTVAVERYVACAAHALAVHPSASAGLGTDAGVRRFVDEVRRWYPFFPTAVARVARPTSVLGCELAPGARVMLDLFGTDHDPHAWSRPEAFDPDRFLAHEDDGFSLVPQGGGDPAATHRCAGEGATVALMSVAVRMLTRSMTYDVPEQDLGVPLRRMPALPTSGVVLTGVQAVIDLRESGPATVTVAEGTAQEHPQTVELVHDLAEWRDG